MRPLTATQAINPALEHTKTLLLQPLRLRTFLKLSAVALIAEAGSGFGLNLPGGHSHLPHISPSIQAALVVLSLVVGIAFLLLGIVLFYISSRLQLVLVELVATRNTYIAPIWRRVGSLTWRWLGFRLLFFFGFVAILVAVMTPFFLITFAGRLPPAGPPSPGFYYHVLLLVAILAPFFLFFITAYILLRDLALPAIVFENLSILAALRRLRSLLAAEPGQIALFVLLRFFLGLGMAIAAEVVFALAAVLSLLPLALLGGGLWLVLRNAGPAGVMLLGIAAALGTLLFLAWGACLGIAALGPVFLFLQSYALYFLGGRYALLGNLLAPQTPPPFPYTPSPGSVPPPLPSL